jgi:hypothetical protein
MANTVLINGKSSTDVTAGNNSEITTISNYFGTNGLVEPGSTDKNVYTDDLKQWIKYDTTKDVNYIGIHLTVTGTHTNSHDWHLYGSWDEGTTKVQMTASASPLFAVVTGSGAVYYARIDLNTYVAPKLYLGQKASTSNAATSGTVYVTKIGK